eukprot:c16264_g1_i2 orf=533-1000(-)
MAESSQEPVTRVLVAVNQSSVKGYPCPSLSSNGAFNWILSKLIRPCCRQRYKLLILHVQVPDEDPFDDMDSLYATAEDFRDMKHKEMKRGLHLLQRFVKPCNELQLPCEAWIKKGDPKEVICKESRRVRADMLVVGSRGLGTLHSTAWRFCTHYG